MASLEVLFDIEELSAHTGYTQACINGWVRDKKFPQPIKAARGKSGRFRSYWKKSDIDRYMEIIRKREEAAMRQSELINEKMLRELEDLQAETDKLEQEVNSPKLKAVKKRE